MRAPLTTETNKVRRVGTRRVPRRIKRKYERKEYRPEAILDIRVNPKTGELEYLIKWVGYSVSESTWEPCSNFTTDFQHLIIEFNTKLKKSIIL